MIFSFAWTWEPVPWVYQAEVFPLRVRVKGSAVGIVSNFLNNWIIAFVGPTLMKAWEGRNEVDEIVNNWKNDDGHEFSETNFIVDL